MVTTEIAAGGDEPERDESDPPHHADRMYRADPQQTQQLVDLVADQKDTRYAGQGDVFPADSRILVDRLSPHEKAGYEQLQEPEPAATWGPSASQLMALGISPTAAGDFVTREVPLGVSRETWADMRNDLFEVLASYGADDVDVRLHGSSAKFYSSDHKLMDAPNSNTGISANGPEAAFNALNPGAEHRPFDYTAAVQGGEGSDFDLNISSDVLLNRAADVWAAANRPPGWNPAVSGPPDGAYGDPIKGHGYLDKDLANAAFPELREWAKRYEDRIKAETGATREVSWSVYPRSGPVDTTATSGSSVAFSDRDWIVRRPGEDGARPPDKPNDSR
jgi:hypothetical protein